MKKVISLFIGCICVLSSFAQAPAWNWGKAGAPVGDCQATAVTTDAAGNVYTGGYYTDQVTFGSQTLTGGPGTRMFLVKYDKNGQLLWAYSSNSDASSGWSVTPYSLKTDANGYLYVGGEAQTRTIVFGQDSTDAGCGKDFVAKFDQQGNAIWGRYATSRGYDKGRSVAVDASGNVYELGIFYDVNIGFGDSLYNHNPTGGQDLFLVKYDSTGRKIWAEGFGGNGVEVAQSLSVDEVGNVYAQGYTQSDTIVFGTTTLINPDTAGGNNMFLFKCDPNGTVLWAKNNGASVCVPSPAGFDIWGNTYVVGSFGSSLPVSQHASITFGNLTLTDSGYATRYFLVKYDANGNPAWAKMPVKLYNGLTYDVVTDATGNVYLAGDFRDSVLTIGTTSLGLNVWGNLFIAKYDSSGRPLWLKGIEGNYFDGSCAIAAGAPDNVYMAASIDGSSLVFDSAGSLAIDSNVWRNPVTARLGHTEGPNAIKITSDAAGAAMFVSPNPVIDNAIVAYTLPSGSRSASLLVYDILGRIRAHYPLSDSSGQIVLSAAGLSDGIYFYTLQVDGRSAATIKIVVAK